MTALEYTDYETYLTTPHCKRIREAMLWLATEASADALDPESIMAIKPEWEGTATELLDISGEQAGEKALRNRKWPKDGRILSNTLKRVVPNLRRQGIRIECGVVKIRIGLLKLAGNPASQRHRKRFEKNRRMPRPGCFKMTMMTIKNLVVLKSFPVIYRSRVLLPRVFPEVLQDAP